MNSSDFQSAILVNGSEHYTFDITFRDKELFSKDEILNTLLENASSEYTDSEVRLIH